MPVKPSCYFLIGVGLQNTEIEIRIKEVYTCRVRKFFNFISLIKKTN